MAFTDEFAESLLELEGEIPQSFTWNGNDYPCFASGKRKGVKLEPYGWGVNADLIIIVRAELFGDSRPNTNDSITFKGQVYRIDDFLDAGPDCYLRLACMNPDRGA